MLVTGDRTSAHLAGRVGLPVASTITSQPEITEAKPQPQSSDEIEAEDEPDETTAPNPLEDEVADPHVSNVNGQVLNVGNKPSYAKPMIVRKAIEGDTGTQVSKGTGKVPDFNKMQKRLLWGGIAATAVIALFVLNYFIASATVTLFAQGSKITTNFTATVDPTIKVGDAEKAVLAATNLTSSHDLTTTTSATGKQDVGTKAAGNMTINNCFDNSPHTFVAGTRFKSPGGLIFVSTADATVPGGNVNILGCAKAGAVTVAVQAEASGDQYNLASGIKYTIPGLNAAQQPYINGTGGQMSGGTSKTVSVVTQADVDKAVADLLAKDKEGAQKDLENKVPSGTRVIKESFSTAQGTITANPAVGAQADQTVVDVKVSYSMFAVDKTELSDVLKAQELKQIGPGSQIYDDGAGSLSITPVKLDPGAASTFTFDTTAFGGAKLDTTAIAKQLTGKRYGDATDLAGKLPGVSKAEVKLSPPWSSKLPRITSHIKVEVKVASGN